MQRTFKDIMSDARKVVPEVTVDQVKQRLAGNGKQVHLIDVREKEEYREGHLAGSVSVPRGFLEMQIEEKVPDRDAEMIVYCQGGTRGRGRTRGRGAIDDAPGAARPMLRRARSGGACRDSTLLGRARSATKKRRRKACNEPSRTS